MNCSGRRFANGKRRLRFVGLLIVVFELDENDSFSFLIKIPAHLGECRRNVPVCSVFTEYSDSESEVCSVNFKND